MNVHSVNYNVQASHDPSPSLPDDDYGVYGVLYLQHLALNDNNMNILDVLTFGEKNDSSLNEVLHFVRQSVSKVIVLNCAGKNTSFTAIHIHKQSHMIVMFFKS